MVVCSSLNKTYFLLDLGEMEDMIFKQRQQREVRELERAHEVLFSCLLACVLFVSSMDFCCLCSFSTEKGKKKGKRKNKIM